MNSTIETSEDIPEEHKHILDDRISGYESGETETIKWDEALKRLLGN